MHKTVKINTEKITWILCYYVWLLVYDTHAYLDTEIQD